MGDSLLPSDKATYLCAPIKSKLLYFSVVCWLLAAKLVARESCTVAHEGIEHTM